MHDQHDGRGADWLLARFDEEEDTVGIQVPPDKKGFNDQTQWTQGGCLAALAICAAFALGLCAIGASLL